MDRLGFFRPAATRVREQTRDRPGANRNAHHAQKVQQGWLAHLGGVVAEGRDERLERGAKAAVVARRQRRQDGLVGCGDEPFLTQEADDLVNLADTR